MNTYIINCIGLAFDIIGAWFIAIEVVYQYKGEKYLRRIEPVVHRQNLSPQSRRVFHPEETDGYKSWEKSKHTKMWIGLILLTIGFSLQIYSNLLFHGNINNEITTNDTINIDDPVVKRNEDDSSHPTIITASPDINNARKIAPLKDQNPVKEAK